MSDRRHASAGRRNWTDPTLRAEFPHTLGRGLLLAHGLDPDDPTRWMYVENGRVWTDFDAMIRVGARSGGWGRVPSLLRIIPRPLRNWRYVRIARNRYAMFGPVDLCALADPGLRARLIG